jgi:hypothetical protein
VKHSPDNPWNFLLIIFYMNNAEIILTEFCQRGVESYHNRANWVEDMQTKSSMRQMEIPISGEIIKNG